MKEIGVRKEMNPQITLSGDLRMNETFGWKFQMPEIPEGRALVAGVHYTGPRPGLRAMNPEPAEVLYLCLTQYDMGEIIMFANMYNASGIWWYTAKAEDVIPSVDPERLISF